MVAAIAGKYLVFQSFWYGGIAQGKELGLGKAIGQSKRLLILKAFCYRPRYRNTPLCYGNKIRTHSMATLVQQLVKSVLGIGAYVAPQNRAGSVGNRQAMLVQAFSVGFHFQLLQVWSKAF